MKKTLGQVFRRARLNLVTAVGRLAGWYASAVMVARHGLARVPTPAWLHRSGTRKALLPVAILLVAIVFTGYLRATRPPIQRNPVEERVWVVSAVTAKFSDQQPELKLFGEIAAAREVELRPLVAGRVVELGKNFVAGAVVRQGELLIAINPFEYASTLSERQAELAEGRAKLREYQAEIDGERKLLEHDKELVALRRRDAARRAKLRKRGVGSQKSLDDARMVLREQTQRHITRQQTIGRLDARISQQKAVIQRLEVGLARARRDLEETRLTAPFDGFLGDTATAVGRMVGIGDRVARLTDASSLEARFHLSDDEYGRLLQARRIRGRAARVVWHTTARDFTFEATIERVSSTVDAASGGVDLYARIKQVGIGTSLRPGVFVEVFIKDRMYRRVVRLPGSALHGGDTVYVAKGERLEARKVTLVGRAGNDVLVRGKIEPGEPVVATAFAEIGPGARVRVK